jgi:hypothetical protein
MGLGTLSTYRVGFRVRSLEVLRVHPERYERNPITGRLKYIPTWYYGHYDPRRGLGMEPFSLYEYELNTLINHLPPGRLPRLKRMLDKKYESYYKESLKRLPGLSAHLPSRYN